MLRTLLYNGGGTGNALQVETTIATIVAAGAGVVATSASGLTLLLGNETQGQIATVTLTVFSAGIPTVATQLYQIELPVVTTDQTALADSSLFGLAAGTTMYVKAPLHVKLPLNSHALITLSSSGGGTWYARYAMVDSNQHVSVESAAAVTATVNTTGLATSAAQTTAQTSLTTIATSADSVTAAPIAVAMTGSAVQVQAGSLACLGVVVRAPNADIDGGSANAHAIGIGTSGAGNQKRLICEATNTAGIYYPVANVNTVYLIGTNTERAIVTPVIAGA